MKLAKLIISVLAIILILAFAAVSVGYFRSHAHAAEPHRFSADATSHTTSTSPADRYQLDSSQSKFIAHAMAGGLLWFEGHDHLVAVKEFSGQAQFSLDQINQSSLQINAKAASMVETSSVFTDQQKQIINKELREIVLLPEQYPDIIFKSTNVTGTGAGANQYDLKIAGDLALHGVTRRITIPTKVTITGNEMRAVG